MRAFTRFPPNFFAIPFGLAGLAVVWRLMAATDGTPAVVSDALFVAAATVWLVLVAGCLARLHRGPRTLLSELRDPVLSPFWALPWIVGMLLALGLQPHAEVAAKTLFLVFLVATTLFGGWLTGQWIAVPLDQRKLHPGYFLPTVAGGLVSAQCAAGFGLRGLGWVCFGIGVVCWLVLGSLIINRLFFLEMVLVQLRLLPMYTRLKFSPGFWAFTFSWCATAALGLRGLQIERPGGRGVYAALDAGAVTVLIAAVAASSLLAIARGQFVPSPPARPAPSAPESARPADGALVTEMTR